MATRFAFVTADTNAIPADTNAILGYYTTAPGKGFGLVTPTYILPHLPQLRDAFLRKICARRIHNRVSYRGGGAPWDFPPPARVSPPQNLKIVMS